jgi:two-component system OmpR family response regulator
MESKRTDCRAHALRVLVVEDDEDTAVSLAMLLRLYGHDVDVVRDGPSAVRALQASPPEVIFLDIGLPKMDGWEVARQIHEQAAIKRPFLVAVSGYGTEADRCRSKDAGIDLHLVKPVDPVELLKLLRRCQRFLLPDRAAVYLSS